LWLAISPNDEHHKDSKGNDSRNEVFEQRRKRYCFHVSKRSKSSGEEEAASRSRQALVVVARQNLIEI
jgi:hypothetical protein